MTLLEVGAGAGAQTFYKLFQIWNYFSKIKKNFFEIQKIKSKNKKSKKNLK